MNTTQICMVSTHGYFDPEPQLGRTDTGGQVVFVLELSKAMATHGIKVDIVTRWFDKSKPQIDPLPECKDVRVIRIHSDGWQFIRKEDIYDTLPELKQRLVAFIYEQGLTYDIFHGHYVDGGIVAVDVAKQLNKPSFFTAHSLGAWKKARMGGDPAEMENLYNFKHRISEEQRVFRSVVAQTATTAIQKDLFRKYYQFSTEKIDVIPPGVNIHVYNPEEAEEDQGLSVPDRYVFCISRIDANKGHDYLLHAFNIVKERIGDVHLIIGGGSPKPKQVELDVKASMREIITRYGMEDRVDIIGYVPDELMAPYYRQADLFVLPSKFEPFGMTALEAMACGTPVIASNLGGIKENFTSGTDGILVDPSDSEELANAMVLLLKDRVLAQKIGNAGHKAAMKKFSWEAIGKRTLEFYDKYLTSGGRFGNRS